MRPNKNIAVMALSIIAALCLMASLALDNLKPTITHASHSFAGKTEPIAHFPSYFDTPANTVATYDMTLGVPSPHTDFVHLMPDDCIEKITLNGKNISIPDDRKCTTPIGILLDLSAYLHPGENHLSVDIKNTGGPVGLDVRPVGNPPLDQIIKALALASAFMAIFWWAGLERKFGGIVMAMLYASLALSFFQYFSSYYFQYAHDSREHASYVTTLVKYHNLPDPRGWEVWQAPFYYLIGALFYVGGDTLGMPDPLYAVRFYSLLLYVGFLITALFILTEFIEKRLWLAMAASLVLFWPNGYTMPGRISNDLGALFTQTLGLYYLVRWHKTKALRYFHWAIIAAALSLMIKGSAIISFAAIGILFLIAWHRREISLRALYHWPSIIACIGGVMINFGRIAYFRWVMDIPVKWMVNVNLDELQYYLVENKLRDYLYLDIWQFISNPFYFTQPNGKGGVLFWNAFLQQLVFDEWTWRGWYIASGLSVLFLTALLFMGYFLIHIFKTKHFETYLPLLVTLGCMVGALISVRIQIPWSAQASGRHIYGIIIIMAIFFTKAIEGLRYQKMKMAYMGIAISVMFSLLSIVLLAYEKPMLGLLVN